MTEIEWRKWREQDFLQNAINDWRKVRQERLRQPLTPPMIAKIWVDGLRAAGVKADLAKVWERGKRHPTTLQMVVEFECPHWHRSADRRSIATVRLLVEDDGWVSLDEDSPCPGCDRAAVERWLLTCSRCEAGEDSAEHSPSHGPSTFGRGDASPLAAVSALFEEQERLVVARWWVEHADEAGAWFEEWLASVLRGERVYEDEYEWLMIDSAVAGTPEQDTEIVPEDIPGLLVLMLPEARRILGDQKALAVEVKPRAEWTDEAAADWLDRQTDGDGALLVSRLASQRQAWSLVQNLPGSPPKNAVERAQSLRKNRPATTEEATQ